MLRDLVKGLGLILIFITLFSTMANGQRPGGNKDFSNMPAEGILTGKVLEKSLDEPMEYANVVLYSMRDSSIVAGTVTDMDGNFKMEEVRYGRFYAIANFIGYNKVYIQDIKITPKQKMVELETIYLEAASTNLEGVEIVADKHHIEYKIDKKIVNVSQDLVGSTGSAVTVLENVPSVQVDIEGNVSLRGTENFQVLVDGKPSVIGGSDALQQIPASTIDHLEIITNPSAKYDPDGVGGIINVVLKEQKQPGLNGVVNASIGTGNKYEIDLLLNYRTKHVNIFGGLDLNYREHQMEGNTEYETYSYDSINGLLDSTNYRNSEMEGKMSRRGYGIRGGLDYYLSDKTTLTLQGRYGYQDRGRDFTSSRYIYTEPVTFDEYSQTTSESNRGGNYYRINLDLLHNFDSKGQKLEGSVYYANRKTDDWEENYDYETDEDWNKINDSVTKIKTIEDEIDYELRLKADYTKPIGANGKLEAGYQSRFNFENEVYTFQDYDIDIGEWVDNPEYSNEADFKRNIHAVYGIYSGMWGTFGYQLGLRGEYTDRNIKNVATDTSYVIDRFDYFPTVHLSKEFKGDHQILMSYSRRIDRPGGRELDPFLNYWDAYNARMGNPALEPEYIDSYELGYQKRFEKSFVSLEGYYRITKNKITRIKTLQEDGTFLHTYENLNKDYALGGEIMINADITKWLLFNVSGNVYNYRLEGSVESEDIEKESTNWDTRANINLKFKPDIRIQLTGMYRGPSVTVQGERAGFFMMNAAIRKDFFNNKLSVILSARDLLKTAKREYISSGENFSSYDHFQREAPIIALNISYLINNYKKQKNGRENGDQDNDMDMDF